MNKEIAGGVLRCIQLNEVLVRRVRRSFVVSQPFLLLVAVDVVGLIAFVLSFIEGEEAIVLLRLRWRSGLTTDEAVSTGHLIKILGNSLIGGSG